MKDQGKLMSVMAYVALVLTAAIQLVVWLVGIFDETINLSVLSFIANIMLTLVVVWAAWQFAKDLDKVWKIIYIIVAVLAVLGSVGVSFF